MSQQPHIIDDQLLAKYLSGEASPEEAMQVAQWLEADPGNMALFHQISAAWNEFSTGEPHQLPDKQLFWSTIKQQLNQPEKQQPSGKIWMMRIGIAASFLLIISLLIRHFNSPGNTQPPVTADQLVHRQTADDIVKETLPDGSIVNLAAYSGISYPARWKGNRTVTLTGMASFDVQSNAADPFIVKAGPVTIKVLGTNFFVYQDSAEIKVNVHTGKVRMYGGGDSLTLLPEQQGIYDIKEKRIDLVEPYPQRLSKEVKALNFQNTTLREVAQALEDHYGVDIIFENRELAHCTISAGFDNQSLDYVLEVISATLNIKYRKDNKNVYLSGKSCE